MKMIDRENAPTLSNVLEPKIENMRLLHIVLDALGQATVSGDWNKYSNSFNEGIEPNMLEDCIERIETLSAQNLPLLTPHVCQA